MKVAKETMRPGTYTYLNETGMPERLTVTEATIKHFHDQGSAMLADGLSIPVPLEHQLDAKVQTASERAAHQLMNNAGFVDKFEIRKVKHEETGVPEDRLYNILDIPDKKILEKLPTTIRSVSPWINSFTDGNGKRWDGVISHVALTTRPRIARQEPFAANTSSMLSLVGSLQDKNFAADKVGKGIELSSAGLLRKVGAAFKPLFPIAFSMMNGIKLSKEIIEEIEEDEGNPKKPKESEGKKPDGEEGEGDPPVDQFSGEDTAGMMEEEAGDVSFEELIPHLLEMHGISVPAGGKGKEFLQALVQGLLASAKQLSSQDDAGNVLDPAATTDPLAAKPKPPGPVIQEPQQMYMSLTAEQVKKITDPEKRQMAEAFLSLQTETSALRKNKIDEATAIRQKRIEKLSRRLPASSRDKLLQMMAGSGAQLSLGSDGVVTDPMQTVLEVFESGIPDLPSMLVNGVKLSEEPQPSDGTISDQRAEEIANRMLGTTSGARSAAMAK